MSCSIQFVRLDDFAADVDVLDFSTAGYSLAQDGYFQVSAPDGVASVHEVITLKLQGTSKDDLAAMTQEIDEKVKQVGWWLKNPGVERYQVWLRVQLENESLPRQAQILSILPPDKVRTFTPEERIDNYLGAYSIAFERTPFWEDVYPYPTTTDKTGLCPVGGMVTLSETISGDVPARLAKLTILESDNRVGLTDFWIGFRSNRFGNASNFTPVWGIDLGQSLSGDTVDAADATAFANRKFVCDFSTTAALAGRCYVTVTTSVASGKRNDQRGTYLVLMRAKMSDASVARARIGYSFIYAISTPPINLIYRSRQIITNQGGSSIWRLYEMGTVQIPPFYIPNGTPLGNFGIVIEAERLSGAGNLELDSFIMIPIAEGAIKVWSNLASGSTQAMTIIQRPNEAVQSYIQTVSDSLIVTPGYINPLSYALPANGDAPLVVIAADRRIVTGSDYPAYTDANIDITYDYIPRWRTLRGNDT